MELSKWAKKKVLVNVSLCILHLYDQTFGYRGIFMFSLISIKFKISSRFTGSYMLLPTQYKILQQRLNQLPALIQFTRIKYSSKIYQFDLDPTLTPDLFVLLLRDLSLVVDLSL